MKRLLPFAALALALSPCLAAPPAPATQPAAQPAALRLPAPELTHGLPLMQALHERRSNRSISREPLSQQHLSEILFAAAGVNRDSGGRTAPSATGVHPLDLYAITPDAIYLYDPASHSLSPVLPGDHRNLAGSQPFVPAAPLNLVWVANLDKFSSPRLSTVSPDQKLQWCCIEAGCEVQNVYLYCASEHLAAVVRTSLDKSQLADALHLPPTRQILCAQTIGHAQ